MDESLFSALEADCLLRILDHQESLSGITVLKRVWQCRRKGVHDDADAVVSTWRWRFGDFELGVRGCGFESRDCATLSSLIVGAPPDVLYEERYLAG